MQNGTMVDFVLFLTGLFPPFAASNCPCPSRPRKTFAGSGRVALGPEWAGPARAVRAGPGSHFGSFIFVGV